VKSVFVNPFPPDVTAVPVNDVEVGERPWPGSG